MYEVLGKSAVPERAEVSQPDAQVPVRSAGKRLVEPAGLEQLPQPHEQVRSLDVRVADEQVVHVEALRTSQQPAVVVERLVVDQPRSGHIQITLRYRLFTSLQVGGRPRIVVV